LFTTAETVPKVEEMVTKPPLPVKLLPLKSYNWTKMVE